MQLDFHIWAAEDGRLVAHGDPDAAVLKYPAGVTIPQEDRQAAEKLAKAASIKPAAKQRRGTSDKQAAKSDDKGDDAGDPSEGATGSGLTINRLKDQPA